jgi:DNA transformation protein and related proteins
MAASREFLDFLKEQMAGFGPVSARRMFGGAGIYHDGMMFGLVADDVLYLKADGETKALFEAEGLEPFAYEAKGGKRAVMSYWRAPSRCLDDPDDMRDWAATAFSTARKASGKRR